MFFDICFQETKFNSNFHLIGKLKILLPIGGPANVTGKRASLFLIYHAQQAAIVKDEVHFSPLLLPRD